MAVYPNGRSFTQSPGRHFGIAPGGDVYGRGRGDRFNRFINTSWSKTAGGLPTGGYPPEASILPLQSGGMASTSGNRQTLVNATANLQQGRSISGTAAVALTVPSAYLSLLARISGAVSLVLTNAAAFIGSTGPLAGAISMSLTVASALLKALERISGATAMALSTSSTLTGNGQLVGSITPGTALSPENLALAVWGTHLEGSLQSGDIMRLLLSVAAGKTVIVDNGNGTATVKFRDSNDTTDRVSTSMTGSSRTSVTLDPT